MALVWDSRQPFNGVDFARFVINGQAPATWATEATAAWTPFRPSALLVGLGIGTAFNGSIGFVQATNAVI